MGKRIDYIPYERAQEVVKRAGIKLRKDYALKYKELGLPADPRVYYSKKGWIDWDTFLEKSEQFIPYDEAEKIVQENGVLSRRGYDLVYKDYGLPSAPNRTYKDKGWIDWDTFLGKTEHKLSYEEASEIVKREGIKDKEEYLLVYKKYGLPKNPNRTYNGKGWIKWDYFLGKYHTFEGAKEILKESDIRTKRQYELCHTELGLPSDPRTYYKEEGWTSWSNLWRELYGDSTKGEEYRILRKLLKFSSLLLRDDAPPQMLYFAASLFKKDLAKKMETLLGLTSYEERLNWVKEQLNSLKKGTPSKTKSFTTSELSTVDSSDDYEDDFDWSLIDDSSEDSSEEDFDELSAMKSVMEEFHDEKETLTEKDIDLFKTRWENYVHGAVNRALIAECDG